MLTQLVMSRGLQVIACQQQSAVARLQQTVGTK
jgi:hypothetical protein